MQRPHHRRVVRHVEHVDAVGIARRVHHAVDGLVVAEVIRLQAKRGPHGVAHHAFGIRRPVAQARDPVPQARVERGGKGIAAGAGPREPGLGQVVLAERVEAHLLEEHRVERLHQIHHLANHDPRFVGRVAGVQHAVQAMQHQSRHGVHHRREGGDRNDVARRLDGLLLSLALHRLVPFGVVRRPQVAQLLQDGPGVVLEQRGELGVVVPRREHGLLVDVPGFAVERRHERPRLLQLHVALTRLLRVVERIGVQHAPHELARDVLEPELEVRVLEHRVVPTLEGEGSDGVALLVGDLGRADHPWRITRAGGGNGAVVGHRRRAAQGDLRGVGGKGQRGHGLTILAARG